MYIRIKKDTGSRILGLVGIGRRVSQDSSKKLCPCMKKGMFRVSSSEEGTRGRGNTHVEF